MILIIFNIDIFFKKVQVRNFKDYQLTIKLMQTCKWNICLLDQNENYNKKRNFLKEKETELTQLVKNRKRKIYKIFSKFTRY